MNLILPWMKIDMKPSRGTGPRDLARTNNPARTPTVKHKVTQNANTQQPSPRSLPRPAPDAGTLPHCDIGACWGVAYMHHDRAVWVSR
jgi:hypothetical protein